MAGLKKKRKDRGASPNVALVVFLVLFILVNIGLGVWLYYAVAEKADAKKQMAAATKDASLKKTDAAYYAMLYYDLRTAHGDLLTADDEEKKGKEAMVTEREEFLKDSPKFANVPADKASAKKLMLSLREKLGQNQNSFDYKTSVQDEIRKLQEELKDYKAKYTDELAKNQRMETYSTAATKKQDLFYQDIKDRIQKGNNATLQAAQVQSDAFKTQAALNQKLNADLTEKQDEFLNFKKDTERSTNALLRKIKILEAERAELAGAGPGGANPNRAGADPFPLILDITTGKPLWDAPIGKIIRVDLDLRQVAINLGSHHGLTPEVTFNIFAAGEAGRGEKQMKGTIEVIRVIGANSSLCRITSLYDSEGRPIVLDKRVRFQLMREADAPLKEGDLLYNLFWGSRVAVAGRVSINGDESHNPADQNRQMEDFLHILKRNGMVVDAFVDLRDGQIHGKLTSNTRYLIIGKKMPVAKGEPGEEKEPAGKNAQPGGDRNENINRAMAQLRKDAVERGMLLISPANFATVIGYRRPHDANRPEFSTFRPGLPYGGVVELPAPPKKVVEP